MDMTDVDVLWRLAFGREKQPPTGNRKPLPRVLTSLDDECPKRLGIAFLTELEARRRLLVLKDHARVLSLRDLSGHSLYLRRCENDLHAQRGKLERRIKLTRAMPKRSNSRLDGLMEQQRRFNERVHAFQKEREWFIEQPALLQGQEYVQANWTSNGEGRLWIPLESEEDARDAEEGAFESLLREFAAEQGSGAEGTKHKNSSSSLRSKP